MAKEQTMEERIAEIVEDATIITARCCKKHCGSTGKLCNKCATDRILALIAADRAGLVEALVMARSSLASELRHHPALHAFTNKQIDKFIDQHKVIAKIDSAMKEMGKCQETK